MKIFLDFYISCSLFSCSYIFQSYSANFENKKINFLGGCPCSLPLYKKELFLKDLAFSEPCI